jgi:leucyl aminopeptidase (aminopeptidase T)
VGCISLLVAVSASVRAQDAKPSDAELARRVVTECAGVEPGDVVAVAGGTHTIPMMEALAIEVQKAGGMPVMILASDRVARSGWVDVPEKYRHQVPHFFSKWLATYDVWIGLPNEEDPQAITKGVSEAQLAKRNKTGSAVLDAFRDYKGRAVWIGYPSEREAEQNGLDFSVFEMMRWQAIGVDYRKLAETGSQIKDMLRPGATVKITSPAGTNLTLRITDRPIFVNDGVVSESEATGEWFVDRAAILPGGGVAFAPVEESVRGKVVVPKHKHRETLIRGIEFEIADGKVQGLRAELGESTLKDVLGQSKAMDMLGTISIGLNPALKVMEENDAEFRPINGAGVVWLSLGNNTFFGGKIKEIGEFGFPVTNATVTIDGKVVVKDGRLTL